MAKKLNVSAIDANFIRSDGYNLGVLLSELIKHQWVSERSFTQGSQAEAIFFFQNSYQEP